MKRSAIAIGCATALTAISACGEPTVRITKRSDPAVSSGALRVVDTLTCPETVGALTRKGSATADGTVCTYGGPRGAEVVLHLVPLAGTEATVALERFETRLHNLMPEAAARIASRPAAPPAREAPPEAPAVPGESADVRLPGLTVHAEGDAAEVRLPGTSISARDDRSRVAVAGVEVHSGGDGQSVRIGGTSGAVEVQSREDVSEVRVNAGADAIRITYILSDSQPSGAGWRAVGYHARGPNGGPMVVATVQTRDRQSDAVFDDAEQLVAANVGA
ncbi:MAG: methyltransferase type 11 [Brevundimonas sp.]|uniref:methyltransferase type 11 n=1 Tax=Brevundimonas sp. TaxID=1871086 RepID=UPI00391BA1EB